MNEKLNAGAQFPPLSLTLPNGEQKQLPVSLSEGSYQAVVFFRGKF